eukprot:TRINITY_DN18842_c0_g2_i1.p1 TRINITY_DN18842_c0_g2~~TRINITY_DN18842_c0_g2_i1.p1  ORF type:complete len:776 (+),score=241.34 TRINITY_DN18842_c0_g2_i1:72-2330(+)
MRSSSIAAALAAAAACHARSICRPNPDASDADLSAALGWVCSPSGGKLDCSSINAGGACFSPNNLRAHCGIAFDAYYQQHSRAPTACDFSGTATVSNCNSNPAACDPCPSQPELGPQCSAWTACATLSGNCCPTDNGVWLDCCCHSTGSPSPCPPEAPTPAPTPAPGGAPPFSAAGLSQFLDGNVDARNGRLIPLSFHVQPADYFANVPDTLRPQTNQRRHKTAFVAGCNATVSGAALDSYQYQTETLLTQHGLNIYDGAVWMIAQGLLGKFDEPLQFINTVLAPRSTAALQTIVASTPCRGLAPPVGTCNNSKGFCGNCYGDTAATQTQPAGSAFFYRSISQIYYDTASPDARCPKAGLKWHWNDWKPILGENAWANLLGPSVLAYLAAGRDRSRVDINGPELTLAKRIIPALKAMRVGSTGAVYYAPHNTVVGENLNAGSSVSTENQASLLAGLKALQWLLTGRGDPAMLSDIASLIGGVQRYLIDAWDPSEGYFRQGGNFDAKTNTFSWQQGAGIPSFAVDCQTWVGTVLGPKFVDSHFGVKASVKLWETTKSLSGYGQQANGSVKGVGYTSGHDIFSGEWTLGAVNWLRTMVAEGGYDAATNAMLTADAEFMVSSVKAELTAETPFAGAGATAILYANRRYYIPFGWWANPLPSLCSTGWMVAVLDNFNPFMVTGAYSAEYTPALVPGAGTLAPAPEVAGAAAGGLGAAALAAASAGCCATVINDTADAPGRRGGGALRGASGPAHQG